MSQFSYRCLLLFSLLFVHTVAAINKTHCCSTCKLEAPWEGSSDYYDYCKRQCREGCWPGNYILNCQTKDDGPDCYPCSTCPEGYFHSGGCDGWEDIQCKKCRTCPQNQKQTENCSATADTKCTGDPIIFDFTEKPSAAAVKKIQSYIVFIINFLTCLSILSI
jgi:hypothetical protein